MPEGVDQFALGKELGRLSSAIEANVEATKANTAALSQVETRLVKGDARMDRTDERIGALPCVKGQALPSNCPINATQTVNLPLPDSKGSGEATDSTDAIKWRWLISAVRFAGSYWREIALAVGGAAIWWKTGGNPPH